MTGYHLWKAPSNGLPEYTSGGHGVTVIPGFGNWVLLHPSRGEIPKGAIPVEHVTKFLEAAQSAE